MIKEFWITGVLIAFSVFGIKVGLGLAPHMYGRLISVQKKVMVLAGAFLTYLALFFSLSCLITHFNLMNYLDQFTNMLRYGMLLHLAVAMGLLFWGAKLLLQNPGEGKNSSLAPGLLLVLPCPVCAVVILLNLALSCSLFNFPPFLTTLILFGSLVSLYFLISIIAAPIYPEIKAAFAMACSNSPVNQADNFNTAVFAVSVFILGGIGFVYNYFLKRN
ncbi:MAG: hypothetical protein B1H13_04860 [Desulfobacteraceae bacterium 4484_190.3]|nr:MAG: hypothetical protein B1H13_04860 [Desulfobacteraceae bacterium 4484_190.3]